MQRQVLIAHAEGEEALAEKLAGPIRAAGYEVVHRGTVLVGESVMAEASKALNAGAAVVLCATIRAIGTGWAHLLVNAARHSHGRARVFVVEMEKGVYVQALSFDEAVAQHWQDPEQATRELVAALKKYYPLGDDSGQVPAGYDAERRYRELALEACDIIDLANLPESDRHLAMRRLELRRLYVPLRVRVEIAPAVAADEAGFEIVEKRRAALRRGEASRAKPESNLPPAEAREPVPVGVRLGEARRLVVLGDPGAGKTTLLRWLATAYLLRLRKDPDFRELPDVSTLPDEDLLPVIVRCRDLDREALDGTLADVLRHVLRKQEISPAECDALFAHLRRQLEAGTALLLLDGLDEITDPALRIRFSRQLEQIHIAYPRVPIIATSRIVGYREMGYRIGRGFEHVSIAELSREDKDDFARRWCAVVEPAERRARLTEELIHDIHSTDRIERLTGNPMLLTTMALVKRKVGRLPNRRVDLYSNALGVLLNWRGKLDEALDEKEALPQLEYLAYAMCDRGVQQLREDEILDLLEQMRAEYPQIHPLKRHTPEEFLRLLERRTGILVEVGHARHHGRPTPLFEFRHLTFQEYLAGLSLVAGHFPNRDRTRTLAQHLAPLAGRTDLVRDPRTGRKEIAVTENWREALRLCIASCNDDDVDSALEAILSPTEEEDAESIRRPRAVMAALCLADEPNVSEETARRVLQALVVQFGQVDEPPMSGVVTAAIELGSSRWADALRQMLVEEFLHREGAARSNWGDLCAGIAVALVPRDAPSIREWLIWQTSRMRSGDEAAAVDAALSIMGLAYQQQALVVPGMIKALLDMLAGSAPAAHAAAWALGWLKGNYGVSFPWRPSVAELERVIIIFAGPELDRNAVRFLSWVLTNVQLRSRFRGEAADQEVEKVRIKQNIAIQQAAMRVLSVPDNAWMIDVLHSRLDSEDERVQRAAARVLGWSRNAAAIELLLARLDHRVGHRWQRAAEVLIENNDARAIEKLAAMLDERHGGVWKNVAALLLRIGDARALESARLRLTSNDPAVRIGALGLLIRAGKEQADRFLLSRDLDGIEPFLDPQQEIGEERIKKAAAHSSMSAEEVRRRYEALAAEFGLRLAWVGGQSVRRRVASKRGGGGRKGRGGGRGANGGR